MRPPAPSRPARFEFEYRRRGPRALIGAFDICTGEVFAHVGPRRTAEDIMTFMEDLARRYPKGEVYIVWDNVNIHCGDVWTHFDRRHGHRFHFVHTWHTHEAHPLRWTFRGRFTEHQRPRLAA